MTFFQQSRWLPTRTLPVEQVAGLQEVLRTHANDPPNGTCTVCQVPGCLDWRTAYDLLAAAGELMAKPDRWRGGTKNTKGTG
jgi:hypothetical protein